MINFLVLQILRDDQGDGLAQHLLRAIAEDAFCSEVLAKLQLRAMLLRSLATIASFEPSMIAAKCCCRLLSRSDMNFDE